MIRKSLLAGLFTLLYSGLQLYAQERVMRLDPKMARGGTTGKIFETMEFIPLETTKASLFGKIDQLEVTDDYYIILDGATNCVLMFKKDGSFYKKIAGGSPDNYRNLIRHITVDRNKRIIYVQRNMKPMREGYDFNCNLISKDSGIKDKFVSTLLANGYLVARHFYNRDNKKDSVINRIVIYKDSVITKGLLPLNSFGGPDANTFTLATSQMNLLRSEQDTVVYLSDYNEQVIYRVTKDTATTFLRFIFPLAQTVPLNAMRDSIGKQRPWEYFIKHPNYISSIGNTAMIGNYLVFRLNTFSKPATMIMNLKTGNMIQLEKVSTDSSSYFLPFATGNDWNNEGITQIDSGYLYCAAAASLMFSALESNTAYRQVTYPDHLKQFFKKGKSSDNPVLIRFKLKDNL
ncbi:6-bladed beta-propeller protein [Chitinophaga jiangningensis]|uniref:6-bladed beta-propeller protein n=1 Tax=Chitinophaga jiangningensis TaxID=1419482 RepID=A0A1M6Y2Y7_9BACT|nr:6-bladed beta-propeller [Chitinophaga jiangningensis]SHL12610.1 6-bladed beta-propeller protein [Chitinophaga jiangningensis]